MKKALIALLFMVGVVNAATELAPASRIRTVTNNYNILTGNVAQVNFNEIDGWLTNHSDRIDGATNLAQQAYDAAVGGGFTNITTLQEAFNHRTYLYTPSNSVTVIGGSAGTPTFIVSTQSIGSIHVGMYISNTAHFASNSQVTGVDWTNNVITIDKVLTGTISASTTAVAVATGSLTSVTFTHTVPDGYSRCRVYVTGSGAGGGRKSFYGAGGGGAGGTSIGYWKLSPGSSYNITVGIGGAGSAPTTGIGSNGVTSSFGSLQSATGGAGGLDDSDGEGDGGIGVGGQINMSGHAGKQPCPVDAPEEPGEGGASFWGGGGYGDDTSARSFGAGGCGGDDSGSANLPGRGFGGVVVIEYY